MQQNAATLQVLQEANTQAGTVGSPFDQARNVGNNEALFVIHTYHAQAWDQSGKWIVGHFRLSGRHCTNEGGFAGVWQAKHANIGQQQQLQQDVTCFTGGAQRFLARRTVNR
ncbi:hypothetical protein D3C86_1375390 [compost metagenome]